MTLTAILGVIGALVTGLIAWLLRRVRQDSKKVGSLESTIKAQTATNKNTVAKADEIIKQTGEVSEIQHRLNTDPTFSKRVREQFSRD